MGFLTVLQALMECDNSYVVGCGFCGGTFVQDVLALNLVSTFEPHMYNTTLDLLWYVAGG